MKTWGDVQRVIEANHMQYSVIRFNMSNAGRLVGTVSNQLVASTVRDAARLIRSELPTISIPARFSDPAYRKAERSLARSARSIRRAV